MNNPIDALDHVRLNFSPEGLFFLNIALAFVMFGVALDIKAENFTALVKRPKSAIVGFVSQTFLLPALTFLLVILLNPTPTIALGMILVAACPGGNISNFISSMAKGNVALSVSLSAISTMAAVFFTPFNFAFWGGMYIKYYNAQGALSLMRPLVIDNLQMFETVFILLGIPVMTGVLIAKKFPEFTGKVLKTINRASLIFFILMVVSLFAANFSQFMTYINLVFFFVLLQNGVAMTSGYLFSSLFKCPQKDKRTIAIETGIQNSGLALALMFNPKIFPPEMELGGMAIIAAWWGIWHIISGLTISWYWSRRPVIAPL